MDNFELPTNMQYTLAEMLGIVSDLTHLQVPGGSAAAISIVDLHGMNSYQCTSSTYLLGISLGKQYIPIS